MEIEDVAVLEEAVVEEKAVENTEVADVPVEEQIITEEVNQEAIETNVETEEPLKKSKENQQSPVKKSTKKSKFSNSLASATKIEEPEVI